MYYIYILRCHNQSLYCGYTNNIVQRIEQHRTGKGGAKYTRRFKPVGVAMVCQVDVSKGDAMRIEYQIKQLPKVLKEQLVQEPTTLFHLIQYSLTNVSNAIFYSKQRLTELWQITEKL